MSVVSVEALEEEYGNFHKHFSLPVKPGNDIPEIPFNLDDLTDSELMSYYSKYTAWLNYAKAQLVLAEIAEENTANDLDFAKASTLINQWDAKIKGELVTIAKAKSSVSEGVLNAQNAYTKARAYRKLVDTVFDRCERGSHLLSRELSRRISIAPHEKKLYKYIP
jgi:hypothetical protein